MWYEKADCTALTVSLRTGGELQGISSKRLIRRIMKTPYMSSIDSQRHVYLFLHGRMDLHQKAIAALSAGGFDRDRVVMASPDKTGDVGDYMAMLWMPPNPDHIKIQKITHVEQVEPEGMIGLWRGVSKDDLFTIPL